MNYRNFNSRILAVLGLISLVTGCGYPGLNDTEAEKLRNSLQGQNAPVVAAENNPALEILIEQKETNGEIISIGSKGVQSISIDGFDYPVAKLIKNQLRIDIPEVSAGKHELRLSLYAIQEPFTVPLVLPNIKIQTIFVLLRLTLDENQKLIKKIEYGFDLDRNGIIDLDLLHFESIGTKSFFVIDKNGLRQPISVALDTRNALAANEAVPPGVVPSAAAQTAQTADNTPHTQVLQPKQPVSNGSDLYPKPPGGTTEETAPVPIEGDKGDNKVPADQEPPTPLPQIPDLP
jgi:hypothetical protein